jgi:tRNA uridine 5-carboxymethylaminomethyl modification enzyme
MGGIAKANQSEIDALGGYWYCLRQDGYPIQDVEQIKGPAMWSPRVQSDRMRFAEEWRLMLEGTPNLDFTKRWYLIIENGKVKEYALRLVLK